MSEVNNLPLSKITSMGTPIRDAGKVLEYYRY
jgi:hypothetical protein